MGSLAVSISSAQNPCTQKPSTIATHYGETAMRRVLMRLVGPLSLALLTCPSACTDPTEPVEMVNPVLRDLQVRHYPFRYHSEWGLLVTASLGETELSLTHTMRMPIRLQTERGDIEELTLRPAICGDQSSCVSFILSMEPGQHIDGLRPYLSQASGRFSHVAYDGSWGSMMILGDGDVDSAIQTAKKWPGVQSAERSGYLTVQDVGSELQNFALSIAVVEFGTPKLGDLIVQTRAGDIVTVEYRQPDGTTLAANLRMCDLPEGFGVPITGLGEDPPCE